MLEGDLGTGVIAPAIIRVAGEFVAYDSVQANLSTDETHAHVHQSTLSATERFYKGPAGGTLAQANTNSANGVNVIAPLTWAGGNGSTSSWADGRIVMLAIFTGEQTSTDLAAFHADPFGTLFVGGAGAATVPRMMTLGCG